MGTKVTSTLLCFYHGRRYRPGTVFELPDGVKPSKDMTVVEDQPKAEKVSNAGKGKGKGTGTTTMSEIAKAEAGEKLKAEIAELATSLATAADADKPGIEEKLNAKKKELDAITGHDLA